ncbi:alanine racemase [Zophobihabitans entericus]|uniref:Alanine racemase n=1 Tax=Zophobihabitans entericus TaxID=1635327 RepID=A0A6G9IBF2_9GAMM|nr:alanine racemase [Zophobihabitans entericus]QIQ20910.1 alanine racemase [Zophobihabitans entericus]
MSVATVEVSLSALTHNVERFRQIAPKSKVAAIVKANAYGHGILPVVKHLADKADYIGVARVSEALAVRDNGYQGNLLVLGGFFPRDDVQLIVDYNLDIVIHTPEQIARLCSLRYQQPVQVWFKLDTGMHRLGFNVEEAKHYFMQLAACDSVKKPINVMSHFCCADNLEADITPEQIQHFTTFLNSIEDKSLIGLTSLAASAGTLAWPEAHFDMVRTGVALYGVSPFSFKDENRKTGQMLGLKPAMTFKSELIAVRQHQKGESVGYGHIWQSPEDTTLGVVAMGYGDGYPRGIAEGTPVLINGQRYPIVGRVAMDMIVVDLGPDSTLQSGNEVIFWGKDLPVEEIAHHSGFSPYELITRLTPRVKTRYVK